MTVSIFRSVFDTSNPFQKDIIFILNRIKEGASKEKIELLRNGNLEKNQLPGVCFNGSFKYRSEDGLIEKSGLIILDFDKIGISKVQKFKDKLIKDEHTFACWISPSGDGLKALFKIPKEGEFINYFNSIKNYFDSPYFDISNKDLPRFCFESYDPDLFLNENCKLWDKIEEPELDNVGSEEVFLPITSDNRIIQNLNTWWEKKYGFIKGQRNNNLFVLANAYNTFGVSKYEAENELIRYATDDLSDREILKVVESAYKHIDRFKTRYFEDEQRKQVIDKQIRGGKNEKDIINEFNDIEPEVVSNAVEKIKEQNTFKDFWTYDKKGNVKLSPHKYKYWLQQNNFSKYFPTKSNTYTFVKVDEAKVEETNEKRIKDFVLSQLLMRDDIGYLPYDFMANNQKYFTPDFLALLESKDIEIKKDTKDSCFLYYGNKVIEVTKNEVNEIDYVNLDNSFVWTKQIIERDYIKYDHHDAEYRKFIWLISGQDANRYNSFKSVIGYLLHSYKTSSNNRAIILNDETISENPNGGSGKGLFTNGLSHLKKLSSIDGKTFDFGKSFPYQTVSTDTQILVFDDVKKNFNFESLFSLITEGITLEYKGQDAIKLNVEESPKILISTNYTIGGIGGSFERRKFEVELSDYFSFKHTPVDEFGHMLFDDWDDLEWSRFDNFMINCVQYYLQNGLIAHDFKNLDVRKFIKNTSFEFYEWTKEKDTIPLNNRNSKNEIFENFINEYNDYKKWLTNKRFKKWLESYAEYYGYSYNDGSSNGVRWFEILTPEMPNNIPTDDFDSFDPF
jgi:hypothetical protein